MKYKTGKIGLANPEIEKELDKLNEKATSRNGGEFIGCGPFRTPAEIHREQVLWAMRMANSILIYDGDKADWEKYATDYRTESLFTRRYGAPDETHGYTKEQDRAWRLSQEETDAIWEAQSARVAKARILHNVGTDAESVSYNSIVW